MSRSEQAAGGSQPPGAAEEPTPRLPRVLTIQPPGEPTHAGVPPPLGPPRGPEPAPAAALPEAPTPLPPLGSTLAGRYVLLEFLGRGGMGVVLAAYDTRLDRRVALKLLPPEQVPGPQSGGHAQPQTRMVREAQAMARLSHPHVVAVYDAGILEDGSLFIAMEYVEGETLKRWCQQQPRTWRELLDTYLAAGRGLAAAHAAGLVHRDFKPDNVLVGRDGRVRVTDFGVARAESLPSHPTPSPLPSPAQAWEAQLTQPGALVGTPRYMAPELLRGGAADARSDLFSFCVALYEALYGQPAFPGSSAAERLRAQREGRLNPPPAKTEVPGWVMRAVLQGLATDPRQRPASMQVLLKALEEDPALKRRARLSAAALTCGVGALAALAAWGLVRQQELQPGCSRMERRLEGVWDSALKARVRQALVGTGLPYAQDSAARVEAALEAYAATWVRRRAEACEAARAQAGQSQSLALLQEYCLERRRSQLRALTELLARGPDKELLEKAVQVARSLPPLESCAEARAPLGGAPLPATFEARAHAEALQEQVDRLEALYEAGKYKEGLALAEELLRQAADAQLEPLRARTLYLAARLQEATADYKGAEARLREALPLASAQGDHALLARAWSLLLALVGDKQGRPQEARSLELAVEVAVAGTQDELAQAESLGNLGTVHKALGSYEPARARYEQALALRRKALGPEHPLVALSLNHLGNVLREMGRPPEALAHYEQALALRQRALGPEHPLVAQSLNNLGTVLWTMGRYQQAREHFEQALALRQKALGPEHPLVAQTLNNLGALLSALGRYEEARQRYEQALEIWSKTLQPEHPNVAASLTNLGTVLCGLGRYDEARARYERALALWQKALGPEHPDVAWPLVGLGRTLVHTRALREAEQHLQRARALQEKALGSSHPALAETLLGLGELRLAQRRPAEALPPLERALPLIQAELRAEVQLALARALWEAGGERQRAQALALEAQAYWEQLGHPRLAEASQWLGSHLAP